MATTISDITATQAASTAGKSTSATAMADASDRFLTLLVSQLKNQDPLNPLDNAQITSQLAQISTVSGINQLNETVAALSASFAANEYLQAAGLVGREVVAPGASFALAEGKASLGVALAADADAVKATIKDASGVVVREIDLGANKAGVRRFTWDGKNAAGTTLADGNYTFELTATAKGATVAADPLAIAKITGVSRTGAGAVLTLGTLGTVALADVLEIN